MAPLTNNQEKKLAAAYDGEEVFFHVTRRTKAEGKSKVKSLYCGRRKCKAIKVYLRSKAADKPQIRKTLVEIKSASDIYWEV